MSSNSLTAYIIPTADGGNEVANLTDKERIECLEKEIAELKAEVFGLQTLAKDQAEEISRLERSNYQGLYGSDS
jgi:hypothetical protein